MIDQFCSFLSCKYEPCNFSALICFLNGRIKLHYIFILQSFSRKNTCTDVITYWSIAGLRAKKQEVSVEYFVQITLRRLWVIWPNYRANLNIGLCNRCKTYYYTEKNVQMRKCIFWYGQSISKAYCMT